MVKKRFPIKTCEELRDLFVEFKNYMVTQETGYSNDQNMGFRITGAGLFVDFLCGIKPKNKPGAFYRHYPDKPWPSD